MAVYELNVQERVLYFRLDIFAEALVDNHIYRDLVGLYIH
jgi:hypothetical protein